jgi:hypothetical protein
MKLAILAGLTIGLLSLSGVALADKHAANGQLPPTNPSTRRLSSTIDDIDVPFDVLNYIQTEYIGHTVTQARRITRNGQQAYQLRVDRDDVANDNDSFYLIYDSNWKLISGKEKVQSSPPAAAPQPQKPKEQRQNSDRQESSDQESSDNDDRDEEPVQEESRNRRGRD